MQNNKRRVVSIFIVTIMIVTLFSGCGSSSSSKRKWSDLSDVEKKNAKWAYDVSKSLK